MIGNKGKRAAKSGPNKFNFIIFILFSSEYWPLKKLTLVSEPLNGYETPPARLIYPDIETAYNPKYTGSVVTSDLRTTKIFRDVK